MGIQESLFLSVIGGWLINILIFSRITNIWIYSLLSLPSTLLHEIAHLSFGYALGAKPAGLFGGLTLIPRRIENGWMLGAVSFRNINSLNAAPVAFAPLILLLTPFFIGMYVDLESLNTLETILIYLLVAYIAHGAIPSEQDLRVALSKPLTFILWGGLIYLFLKNFTDMI